MSLIYNNMRSVEEERKKITEYIKNQISQTNIKYNITTDK